MRLLLDENLSRRLVPFLQSDYFRMLSLLLDNRAALEAALGEHNVACVELGIESTDSSTLNAVPPAPTSSQRGFTLTEMAVVLVIIALLIGGMMIPLSAQQDIRYVTETQKTMGNINEALLGFTAANGRLPCPASTTSNGQESFAAGGDASNGNCSNFQDGFLPAVTLGINPVDQGGFAIDAWGQRIRYAVYSGTINGVGNPFTRADGIKSATMTEAAKVAALSVCATATGIDAVSCNTARILTDRAPAIFLSTGRNWSSGGAGPDETANLNGDPVFVSHEAAPDFDDMLVWLSPNILFNRMLAAGKLP